MRRSLLLSCAWLAASCGSTSQDPAASTANEDSGAVAATEDAGDAGDASLADAGPTRPTPGDIQWRQVNPIPPGEWIVWNDWNPAPNTLSILSVDGATRKEIFEAARIWSFNTTRDGMKLAFSSVDPNQEADYGLTIGDTIQYSWLLDSSNPLPRLISFGNLNDECHTFDATGNVLWVCRRYDFDPSGSFSGYRIGTIDLATDAFTWVTDKETSSYSLNPQPTADGASLFYGVTRIISGSPSSAIYRRPLPTGAPVTVQAKGAHPALSPDGARIAFNDYSNGGKLAVMPIAGGTPVQVSSVAVTSATWSPDGTRLAYLLWDEAGSCEHIEIVGADGADAGAATRILDCTQDHEFPTRLAWITK